MSHKLLLADDSVTIQRVIELTFADEDIQVVAVGDGRQAIEQIAANPPDIVLADVGMPERDGYEVSGFVKADPALSHIPVLLLTGAFEPVDEARARSAGCDGVLAKPFEPQLLIARVKELVAAAKARKPPLGVPPPAPPMVRPVMPLNDRFRPGAPVAPSRETPVPPAAAGLPRGRLATPARQAVPPSRVVPPPFVRESPVQPPRGEEPRMAPEATPAPPAAPQPDAPAALALDEYFDRLDAAFANLTSSLATDQPAGGQAWPTADVSWPADAQSAKAASPPAWEGAATAGPGDGWAMASDASGGAELAPESQAAAEPEPPLDLAPPPAWFSPSVAAHEPDAMVSGAEAVVSGATAYAPPPAPGWPAAPAPAEPPSPAVVTPAATAVVPLPPPRPVADTFAALLAVEQGEASPESLLAPAGSLVLTDEIMERIARRVLEQMTAEQVREIVADITSRVAERLVREEIERVKAGLS
jgi:CheY-like chemotaxis protein